MIFAAELLFNRTFASTHKVITPTLTFFAERTSCVMFFYTETSNKFATLNGCGFNAKFEEE